MTDEKTMFFSKTFDSIVNPFIRRQIVVAMSNWGCDFWLSDRKNSFNNSSVWERRAIIYSSFYLNDEGKHWRSHNKALFSSQETFLTEWFGDRKQKNKVVLP